MILALSLVVYTTHIWRGLPVKGIWFWAVRPGVLDVSLQVDIRPLNYVKSPPERFLGISLVGSSQLGVAVSVYISPTKQAGKAS